MSDRNHESFPRHPIDSLARVPSECAHPLRILLIDDDKDCHIITEHLLTQTGVPHVLEWMSSYEAGLKALARSPFDACLLDYRLGARDGLELLRCAVAQGCRVPIIMLTGQGDQRIDVMAMHAGAADYLVKDTLDAPRLERSIRYAVEHRRLLDRLSEANDILEERVQERTSVLVAEIGERHRAEAALRESEAQLRAVLDTREVALKEKELLLRELHHRVKNNLQIISSLLSLQGSRIQDRASRELFQECQHRVRTIALVHDKLHKRPNLASLDLAAYMSDLVENLLRCYRVSSGAVTPRIVVDEMVTLGIDHLIPCALIVNELVCNALKYAFPDGRSGEVGVELRQRDGQITLMVVDNGVGFPPSEMSCGSGMGQQIVQALVDQLSGKLAWANDRRTSATVTFPGPVRIS